jgi:iron-sulfur cluster repair protein YtfE (RIC family)
MKEDLSALDKTFSLLRNQDISTQELRNQLQKLSQSVTKNKDISTKDVSKLSDYYYREVYTSYYQEMEATIGYLNRLADKLDDTRSDEGDLNAAFGYASSGYNATIEKYNTFVNQ